MKRKLVALTSIATAAIALSSALIFACSSNTFPVFSSPSNEYSITFDHTHNYNPHLYNSNYYKRFYGYSQRGTELEFLEQSLYTDENGWCYAQSTPHSGQTSVPSGKLFLHSVHQGMMEPPICGSGNRPGSERRGRAAPAA